MRKSLRWRLQLWYGLVLVAVIAGFAGLLYQQVRSATLRQFDSQLEAAAGYLDVCLRPLPLHDPGNSPRGRPDGPPPDGPRGPEVDGPPFDWPRGEGPPGRPGGPSDLEREPLGSPPREGKRRPGRRPPPSRDQLEGRGFPPPRPRGGGPPLEQLIQDVRLPPEFQAQIGSPTVYFGAWREDGVLLKSSGLKDDSEPPSLFSLRLTDRTETLRRPGVHEAVRKGPWQSRILVGASTEREDDRLRAFAWQLVGGGIAAVGIGLLGGWWVSSRIFRPVSAISRTAAAISASNLSERIDAGSVDRELAELAGVLNAAFDRLESAFERQAQFTADASHELRTPLAILRSHSELALSRTRSADEYRDTIRTCLQVTERMGGLVDGLLTLARTDAGMLELERQPVDLQATLAQLVEQFRPLADRRRVTLRTELIAAEVLGDRARLEQVFTNLLGNAIRYNREGGEVCISIRELPDAVLLTVADNGVGIPLEDQPHLFERFYRVDKARTRSTGGSGLGLAISRAIVQAHGGAIGFDSYPGSGSAFWVRLPIRPNDSLS